MIDLKQNNGNNVQVRLLSLEQLGITLNLEATVPPGSVFNFNTSLNLGAQADQRLLIVVTQVEIRIQDQEALAGSYTARTIFEVVNFEQVVTVDSEGNFSVPQIVQEVLASISISTVRGMMFQAFKGTLLHFAILPILDPKSLVQVKK